MAAPSFSPILSMKGADIEKPRPLPVGTYLAVVQGQPKMDKSSKKQTPYVEFSMKLMQAMDDVDQDDLAHALTKPSGEKVLLTDKALRLTYYLTPDSAWRIKQFLKRDLQIEDADSKDIGQQVSEAPGCQCIVTVKHRVSENGEDTFAEIGSTAKAE